MHNPDPYPPPQGQQGAGGPPPQQVQPTAIQVSVSQPQLYKVMTMSIMGPHPQNVNLYEFFINYIIKYYTKTFFILKKGMYKLNHVNTCFNNNIRFCCSLINWAWRAILRMTSFHKRKLRLLVRRQKFFLTYTS